MLFCYKIKPKIPLYFLTYPAFSVAPIESPRYGDACNIYPHQAGTNANDKMTVKDDIFYNNIMHTEKYSNINCTEWRIPAKKVSDLNCEVQDLLLEVVDLIQEVPNLRSSGIPQFNR